MAEARQAVGLTVTADGGLKFDFGEDVIHLVRFSNTLNSYNVY